MTKDVASDDDITTLEDGYILDYITNNPIKDNPKEQVRQRISRALFHEYGISVQDMEPGFPIKVNGKKKKVDIAIFGPNQEHVSENIHRVVVCQKEAINGKKGAFTLRDHKQAEKDVQQLWEIMSELDECKWGLWTNGLELFFYEKESTRFATNFKPVGDWPLGDESMGSKEFYSSARLRRADPEMLKITFRRCHNYIHGNEGMPKDTAFWQFLYLIFAKMHDEKQRSWDLRRFWAGPTEQFDEAGRKAIRDRVIPLFDEVKEEYTSIFRGNEEITLSDRALAFMVSELAKYDFTRTDVDAKGSAYQEIVGSNLRGDRGQFFTPRGAIKLMVNILDPKPGERMLDPAGGTGGFLIECVQHIYNQIRKTAGIDPNEASTEEFLSFQDQLKQEIEKNLFGAEFDQHLVRAAQMNVVMASNAQANLFHMNSLEFPLGNLDGVQQAKDRIPLGSMDVIMTNPPFGSDIPITEPSILQQYELARIWDRTDDGAFINSGRFQSRVAPEVLFIERCIQWLRPGGRMGIVLPNGILSNPGDEYIRWWILRNCWVLASIEIPVEAFIVEANVNILTSLLFLKKKTDSEKQTEDLSGRKEYPVFLAKADTAGVDRRGNTLYKRRPDGEEIIVEVEETEYQNIGGKKIVRTLKRKDRVIDNDLPLIAEKYHEFQHKKLEH